MMFFNELKSKSSACIPWTDKDEPMNNHFKESFPFKNLFDMFFWWVQTLSKEKHSYQSERSTVLCNGMELGKGLDSQDRLRRDPVRREHQGYLVLFIQSIWRWMGGFGCLWSAPHEKERKSEKKKMKKKSAPWRGRTSDQCGISTLLYLWANGA